MDGQLGKVQKEVDALQGSVENLKKGYNPEKEATGFSKLEGLRTKYDHIYFAKKRKEGGALTHHHI